MGLTVRQVDEGDFDWILDLLARNQRQAVSPQARERQGFVQGTFSVEALRERLHGPGMVIAELDGERAGVLLSSAPEAHASGPPGRTLQVARDLLGNDSLFLYGPAVVDQRFRSQGVLGALASDLFARIAHSYTTAIAFIESTNSVSRTVHQRLGWTEIGSFDLADRAYLVLSHPTGLSS